MIPGVMMSVAEQNYDITMEQWTYENWKMKNKKMPVGINSVKCIVNNEEVFVPFDVFAIHVHHMIERIELWPKEKIKQLYSKYPVRGSYNK